MRKTEFAERREVDRATRKVAVRPLALLALVAGIACSVQVVGQQQTERFGPTTAQASRNETVPRALELERRFLQAQDWSFLHAVSELPPDMASLLRKVAANDVVGPGEPMDLSDMLHHSGRSQHHYTAVTERLGLIVWFTGGGVVLAHAVLYDRGGRDACVYDLGRGVGPVLPLDSSIRGYIETRGARVGGCKYIAPDP